VTLHIKIRWRKVKICRFRSATRSWPSIFCTVAGKMHSKIVWPNIFSQFAGKRLYTW
jgi:hypothetical protein